MSGSRLAELSPEKRALLFERLRRRKEEGRDAPEAQTMPRRPEALRNQPAPLSFAQQRLWFLDRLSPGDPSYNIPVTVTIEGSLDPETVHRALHAVIGRHESLRTTFDVRAGAPVQIVAPRREVPLLVVDLPGLPGAEAEAVRACQELFELPFDLAAGPLLRATLLRLGPRRHVLSLVLHHIVTDGWSMEVLIGDLAAIFAGEALPSLPVQYTDYSAWQRDWLSGERLERLIAFWRERLGDVPAVLELPTDRPRPPVKSAAGADVDLPALTADANARIRSVAREEGVTLFMLLLTVQEVLLSRWSGQELFAVGSVIANRGRPELAKLIGFFVNTLVLRVDLRGDASGSLKVRELLARVRDVTVDAFSHQDVPFEKLVEELRPARDPSRSPIFQVSFTLQNTPRAAASFGELALKGLQLPVRHVKFDLDTAFDYGGQGELRGSLTYSTALYDAATAERMMGHFRTLLTALLEDRDRPVADLPLLTAAEAGQLEAWNRTAAPLPVMPPEDRFAALAAAEPGAPALVSAAGTVTRGELDAAAHRLARWLRRLGVGPEVPVGVVLPRSPELVLAALAVARSGGVYLPLDPSWPPGRIAEALAEAGAQVVLEDKDFKDNKDIKDEEENQPLPSLESLPSLGGGLLSYIISTSGSTGRPKSVGVPRGALASLIAWSLRALPPAPGDRATLIAGPSFDGSVWELWFFLASGAAILVPEEEIRLSPPRLAAWLRRERITRTFLPTPLAEALLAEPEAAELPLHFLATGGDRLHRISRRDLPFPVVDCYGPSEATVITSCNPDAARDPSVGRPIDNAQVRVLDAALRPVPVGVPGELWIGGEVLARGYLGQPDSTAAAWRPDPFAAVPGARLYRSGDRARWRPDGTIEVLGRLDHQVKVRGFRIETGEIEATLVSHPAVRQAVVLPKEGTGGRSLVTYLVAGDVADDELRGHLRRRLPEFMVPAHFVRLPALPLTPGGKVDRAALGGIALPVSPARAVVPPRSATERTLAALWAEVLGRAEPGVDESFFDLGGHSLLLTRLQARIGEELGREVPLLTLIEHPTIAAFAIWLEGRPEGESEIQPASGASRDRVERQRQALELQRQRMNRRPSTR